MSEHIKSLSDAQVAEMREHFYKLVWGQNETMWKCWNQALDYLAPRLSASQAREAELREKLVSIESAAQDEIGRLNEQKRVLAEKLEAARTANGILNEELQATEAALKLSAAKYNQDAGVSAFVSVKAKELTEAWKQRAEAAEAKIKASQEQVPEDVLRDAKRFAWLRDNSAFSCPNVTWVAWIDRNMAKQPPKEPT